MRSLLVLVLWSLAGASIASAAEDPESLISVGNNLRRKGDDARAEGYFKRAYDLARTPRAAAQLGLVELALKRYLSCDSHLTEALAADDAWIRGHAQALEGSRVEARRHLLSVKVTGAPADATAKLADGSVVPLGSEATLWFTPGSVSFDVQAIGRKPAEVAVAGAAGDRREAPVVMALVDAPPPSPPVSNAHDSQTSVAADDAAASRAGNVDAASTTVEAHADTSDRNGRGLKIGGIATAGVGVVAGVVGALVFVSGNTKRSNYADVNRPYDASDANYASVETTGVALMVGGGVAIAGGVVMYVLGARAAHAHDTDGGPAVSLNAGPGFGLVQWGGRF